MIYLIGDIAEFNKDNNLKRNLMIGAGLLGGVALTTIGVRSYLRNGKLVRQSTRKVNKVNDVIDPMKLTTPKEIIDNHQSVVRLVVMKKKLNNITIDGVLNTKQLDDLIDEAVYWKIDPKNTPRSNSFNFVDDLDGENTEMLIEIAHTAKPIRGFIPYAIKNRMNANNKGTVLSVKRLNNLSGLQDFNRI